tara:strand:+ start:1558 stop:3426 length:1869 start_codon:yes stop_codon:yes gene_type:complete
MKNNILITIILFSISCLSAQVNLSNLSNDQLDKIRLQAEQSEIKEANSDDNIELPKNSYSPSKVEIIPSAKNDDGEFFGYNFLKKPINFFDNIPTPKNFKLGSGDEIILSLWGETNSRESFILNKDGAIYYSNIGFINLSNKTVEDAEALLTEELSKIYSTLKDKKTKLNVELGKTKSINVYFTGQVNNPGINLIHPFSDIFSALVQSGGVNSNGSLRKVTLIRDGETLNIYDFYTFFLKGINNFSDDRLLDGDIIHIPPVEKRVEIQGAIVSPSLFELLPGESFSELLFYASGYTDNSGTTITVIQTTPKELRSSDDFAKQILNLKIDGELNNILINNGDIFIVNSITNVDSKAKVLGRVKRSGEFSISNNFSLKRLLDLAGGFEDPIFKQSINTSNISVLRKNQNSTYSDEFIVNYTDANNFIIKPNDLILVYRDSNYLYSKTYTIAGEVKSPGTYQLLKNFNIEDSISKAGGYTAFANKNFIIASIDSIQLNNSNFYTQVVENMEIIIPPFEKTLRVTGNVYNPGIIDISNGRFTVAKAIESSGGLRENSRRGKIIVTKINGTSYKPSFIQKRFKKLDFGDIVSIPAKEDELDVNQFINDISSTLANLLTIFVVIDRID